MNDRELLPQSGQFYKANLHCHTVLSDGTWTKEQVKAEYQKKGYSIVAFTDHRHYGWHPELQDDSFLPIAGFEADMDEPYSIPGDWNRCKTYHLNFYDTDPTQHVGFTAPQPPQRYGDMYSLNGHPGRRADLPRRHGCDAARCVLRHHRPRTARAVHQGQRTARQMQPR